VRSGWPIRRHPPHFLDGFVLHATKPHPHLYAWTADKALVQRHRARRDALWIGRGSMEMRTATGILSITRDQTKARRTRWKDSGDAIVYEDGTPVPSPLAPANYRATGSGAAIDGRPQLGARRAQRMRVVTGGALRN
jgi:hypothetical protein